MKKVHAWPMTGSSRMAAIALCLPATSALKRSASSSWRRFTECDTAR